MRDDVPIQTHPLTPSVLKLAPPAPLEKRKTMSKKLDTSKLPSHRGNKRLKVDSLTPSTTPVVVLDPTAPTASAQPLVVSKVDACLPPFVAKPSNSSPKAPHPEDSPMTLLRSENLA